MNRSRVDALVARLVPALRVNTGTERRTPAGRERVAKDAGEQRLAAIRRFLDACAELRRAVPERRIAELAPTLAMKTGAASPHRAAGDDDR